MGLIDARRVSLDDTLTCHLPNFVPAFDPDRHLVDFEKFRNAHAITTFVENEFAIAVDVDVSSGRFGGRYQWMGRLLGHSLYSDRSFACVNCPL